MPARLDSDELKSNGAEPSSLPKSCSNSGDAILDVAVQVGVNVTIGNAQ